MIHGNRSAQVQAGALAEQAEALGALAENRACYLADLGGDQRLGLIEEFAFQSLIKGGVFAKTGKQRAVVATFMTVVSQRSNLAKALGLPRRSHGVPQTVGELVAAVKGIK